MLLAGNAALFFYDTICTLPEEYEYIWRNSCSLGKVGMTLAISQERG
jgi:hypothetical protein